MNRNLENLEKFAELLKRDMSLQKIGIDSGSELQKKIDRAIERIDSGDIPDCLIRPNSEPGHD